MGIKEQKKKKRGRKRERKFEGWEARRNEERHPSHEVSEKEC